MKIIHSADWQLGKSFGRFESALRSVLTEARFDAIDALGHAAAQHDARHIVVAGDVFDTEGPEDRTIVQAISRMARYDCYWWLLPGNHDFSRNGGLWNRFRQRATGNDRITVLSEPKPCEIEAGIWILPAPLIFRHSLEDPTEVFDTMQTPGAKIRLGVAHGSIRDFGAQGDTKNQITPDRAKRSNLDYLALGDWHGMLRVDARTWYSGTPETDRFQRDAPGQALVVELRSDDEPVVTPIRTGRFQWLKRECTIHDQASFEADLRQLLEDINSSDTLLDLTLDGIVSLGERVSILRMLENDLRHRLRYLEVNADNLIAQPSADDLDELAHEGILGAAAAQLKALSEAQGPEAITARRALERLFIEYNREERT